MKKTIYLAMVMLAITMMHAQPLQWAKSFGGTSGEDGRGIAVDASGNVYTTGYFLETADFDPGPGVHNLTSSGSYDAFICKLDASGAFVWAVKFGGSRAESGLTIAVDASGNVYVTGAFQGTADFDPGPGTYTLTASEPAEIFVCKIDKDGDFAWARQLNLDNIESLAVDPGGNVYLTGGFNFTVDLDPGPGIHNLISAGQDDIFISKLDASGNFVWARRMGSTGGDHGRSIATDAAGNVYSIGNYENTVDFDPGAGTVNLISEGGWDIYVQKLNASGDLVWAKSAGGPGWDEGRSISVDPSSGSTIYIAGGFEATCDFDPGPGVTPLTSAGGYDVFISRLNGTGDLTWAKRIGGAGYDMAYCAVPAGGNKVYTLGTFSGTVDFDPGPAVKNLSAGNMFLSGLDGSGSFETANPMLGSYSTMRLLASDASANFYVTGGFQYTVDFDPGPDAAFLTSSGSDDVFILKMGVATVTNLEQLTKDETAFAYPNPNYGEFFIRLKDAVPARVVIYDLTGKIVQSTTTNDALLKFDISKQLNGIYFLEIRTEKEITRTKLIKQ